MRTSDALGTRYMDLVHVPVHGPVAMLGGTITCKQPKTSGSPINKDSSCLPPVLLDCSEMCLWWCKLTLRANGGRENLKSSINGIDIHFRHFVEVPAQKYCQGGMSKARAAAQLQKRRPIEIFGEFVPPGEASIAMAALNDKCRSVAKYRNIAKVLRRQSYQRPDCKAGAPYQAFVPPGAASIMTATQNDLCIFCDRVEIHGAG